MPVVSFVQFLAFWTPYHIKRFVALRMKGKGKGDRSSQQHDDCPLQFPSLKPVDHVRLCPRYSAGAVMISS